MAPRSGGEPGLSPEAREAVWRIFGAGTAPGARASVFESIEPVIRKHVPPADRDRAIAMIGAWFDSGARASWLKPDHAAMVADLVIEGVGPRRSEGSVWAVGSIGLEHSVEKIKRRWTEGEVESFVDAAVKALNGARARTSGDRRLAGLDPDVVSFRSAVSRDGLVAAFAQLEEQSLELVNQGLHPAVANLIDLVVELSSEPAPTLISRLEVPTMQARAARRIVAGIPDQDPGATLEWITEGAGEGVTALAIVHVLGAARMLDESRAPWGAPPGASAEAVSGKAPEPPTGASGAAAETDSGEAPEPPTDASGASAEADSDKAPEPPTDVVDDLVQRLVGRLATLDPACCLRWIGEVLNQASRVLSIPAAETKPRLLAQLEDECTRLAASQFSEPDSQHFVSHFQLGLCPGRGRHWARQQVAIARAIRELAPDRAEELARATLDEHRRQIAERRDGHYLAPDWNDWKDREWLEGLGTALALSRKDLDLRAWVGDECRDLPLSVWDAEEDPDGFASAEQIAQHWLLVGLLAIPARRDFGWPLEPRVVSTLAQTVWAHCRFCQQHLETHPEASIAAELGARYAIQYGQGSDEWLIHQARSEGVGPGALRILLEERRSSIPPLEEGSSSFDDIIVGELVRIAVHRFDKGGQFDLETLKDWGALWLSIDAVDQAEQTAMAILSFPLGAHDRKSRILVLKLLGLVVRRRKPRPGAAEYVVPLYNQLWPVFGGTPSHERADREEIDRALRGSNPTSR